MKTVVMRRLLCVVVLATACEPGNIALVEPGSSEGGVKRSVFTVRATVALEDSALADSLGWQEGVPGAEVHLLLKGTGEWITAETDAAGTVEIKGLLPGIYRVYAGRTLATDEAARVGGVTRAFGDGQTLELKGSTELALALLADRPGSLEISEFGFGAPPAWETNGSYLAGMYLEVSNNADSVIYLDGKVFGTNPAIYAYSPSQPCDMTEPARLDSTGVYVKWALAFPGTGSDYPLAPGEFALVAVLAIDHTPIHPMLLDLSDADFEIGGQDVADNPDVPNMIDVGLADFKPQQLFPTRSVFFLSEPVDPKNLTGIFRDIGGKPHALVPAQYLLDVVATMHIWPLRDAERQWCSPMIHERFDRYEGGLFEIGFEVDPALEATRSLERHFLRLEGGRPILMNTNTSAVDFFLGTRTPGRLPQ